MAEQASLANQWMAEHRKKGKAWKSLFEGVKLKGRCFKHPNSTIQKKVDELIKYNLVSTSEYMFRL